MSYALKEFRTDWAKHQLPQSASLVPRAEYQPPSETDIADLSTQQKLALLQMSRRISHQAIWRAMKEKFEASPFDRSTFRQLRELGLAELLDGQKYHSLTTTGAQLCDRRQSWSDDISLLHLRMVMRTAARRRHAVEGGTGDVDASSHSRRIGWTAHGAGAASEP